MRLVRMVSLLATLVVASNARAQTGTPPTGTLSSPGSCTGSVTATIGLAAPKTVGVAAESVSLSYAPYLFGKAECDCDTKDVFMRIQLSVCLPAGTQGNPTLWVGTSGCSNYTTRTTTNQTQCQQYTATNVTGQTFNAAGGNCSTTTFFDVLIPSRALFSPNVGSCDIAQASNEVFVFIGADQTTPVATCTLPLTEQITPPTPVVNVNAASGDGAITVNWSSPPVGSLQADSYQVLCADLDGNPVPGTPADPWYSTCLSDGIHRRQNIFGGTQIVDNGDLGTGNDSFDLSLGLMSADKHLGGADPAVTDDMGTDDLGDGGTDGGSTADMANTTSLTSGPRTTNTGLPAPFDTLDPRFICSDRIPVTAQDYSKRIEGLTNDKTYRFVVVAIDLYGNAAPTAVYEGTPRPVDDLYARYRDAGGNAQGFCFVATAAYGNYDHPQVRVLRAFRDGVLAESAFGRWFTRAYYATSPPLARFIAEGPWRRAIARGILWPLVGFAMLALRLGSLLLAFLVAGGVPALALWLRRRRLRRRRPLVEVPV